MDEGLAFLDMEDAPLVFDEQRDEDDSTGKSDTGEQSGGRGEGGREMTSDVFNEETQEDDDKIKFLHAEPVAQVLPFKTKQKKNASVHVLPRTRAGMELAHDVEHHDGAVVPEIEDAVVEEKIVAEVLDIVEAPASKIIIVDKILPKRQSVELPPVMTVTVAPKMTFVMEPKIVAEPVPIFTPASVVIAENVAAPVIVANVVEVEPTATIIQPSVAIISEEKIAPVVAVTDIIVVPVIETPVKEIVAEVVIIKQEASIVAVPETVSQEIILETVVEKMIAPVEMFAEETIEVAVETIVEPVKELWPKNAVVISQPMVVAQPELVIENDVTEIIEAVTPEVIMVEELSPVPMTTKTGFTENFPQDAAPILPAPHLVDNTCEDSWFKAKTHDMKHALHIDFHETSFMYVGGTVVLPLQREEKNYWEQLFVPAA